MEHLDAPKPHGEESVGEGANDGGRGHDNVSEHGFIAVATTLAYGEDNCDGRQGEA